MSRLGTAMMSGKAIMGTIEDSHVYSDCCHDICKKGHQVINNALFFHTETPLYKPLLAFIIAISLISALLYF